MDRYKLSHIIALLLIAVLLTGCSEELSAPSTSGEIEAGDAVTFATFMPSKVVTRADDPTAEHTAFNTKMGTYKAVAADYDFTVEMYEKDVVDALGSAVYVPTKTIENKGTDDETITYAEDGTLVSKEGSNPLYWPGNAKKYGFKATANTAELATDQSTAALLLAQDKLQGYGFEPLWDTKNNVQVDNENELNYRTSKEWYAANQSTCGMVPVGVSEAAFYKKIPLYLQHQRSMITIILKADEGVQRSALAFDKAQTNIKTYIYSYKSGEEKKELTPFAQQTHINYASSDFGGAADNVETTKYTAVVEPHDYLKGATSDVIAEIQLSGMRFTFYAGNDFQYKSIDADYTESARAHMANYNLPAGKHLIITASLGRASRKIFITAYVVDWTEAVTASVVDDYGQAGDPVQINTRQELYEFLSDDTKNKPGSVAIIVPGKIDLDKSGGKDAAWSTPMPLNCMLNLAGATLCSKYRVFSTIGSSGNLVNGTIAMGADATVDAAVAETNLGNIERVNIVAKDYNNNSTNAQATRAGMVVSNSGTITSCTSELPVKATASFDGFIGGIAAEAVYSTANGRTMPVIDRCTVNARVDEADGEDENASGKKTKGGGIVGQAVGRVSNNRFEYGMTIRQNADRLKNIIQCKAGTDDTYSLRAYGNSWPTTAANEIKMVSSSDVAAQNPNGTAEADRYTAVIDSQGDLNFLQKSGTYNTTTSKIRLSADFAVTDWTLGTKDDQLSSTNKGNVFYELDGNNKTITTDGMLFTNIQNHVHDLTVKLSKDLIATPTEARDEAIAVLAYSVYGKGDLSTGKITNIKVKGGDYRIQAHTVGGIVVWAYKEAVIEDCQCKANIQTWVETPKEDARTYAGGIAACAALATFNRCTFHNTSGTLYRNKAANYDDEEEADETAVAGIYYGGILGGTVPKGATGTEYPSVLITDCASWFSTPGTNYKGAIVGYTQYDNSGLKNGIADGCQGNWWNTSADAVGTSYSSMTDEEVVGKRNAVKPTQDTSY